MTDSTDCGVSKEFVKFLAFGTIFLPQNATTMPHILISTQIRLVRTFFRNNLSLVADIIAEQSPLDMYTCKPMLFYLFSSPSNKVHTVLGVFPLKY